MLRITVELISHGDETRKKIIGVMEIANDGTGSDGSGNSAIGHYNGTLRAEPAYTGRMPGGVRRGRVTNFARRTQSVWSLVGAFLKMWGHAKHPEKHLSEARTFGQLF